MSKKTEYERVKEVWYKKLKDEGFNDIERSDESVRIATPNTPKYKDPDLRQLVQDYYCMAHHFLNEHAFESELEKVIWEYHTEGLSVRSIVKLLHQTKVTETNRVRVWKTVRKLEDIMKGLYLSV